MKKSFLMMGLSLSILAGCAGNTPVTTQATEYNANEQARIRVYGQNGKPTLIWHGIDCNSNQRGTKVNVGGGLGDAFGSLTGSAKSESIGIAPSEISQNLSSQNGILSKAMFREMPISSGKPVNVQASYIGLSHTYETPSHIITAHEGSCNSKVASFIPQAGKDYEVVGTKGKSCGVAVYEVSHSGTLTPVPLQNEFSCKR